MVYCHTQNAAHCQSEQVFLLYLFTIKQKTNDPEQDRCPYQPEEYYLAGVESIWHQTFNDKVIKAKQYACQYQSQMRQMKLTYHIINKNTVYLINKIYYKDILNRIGFRNLKINLLITL